MFGGWRWITRAKRGSQSLRIVEVSSIDSIIKFHEGERFHVWVRCGRALLLLLLSACAKVVVGNDASGAGRTALKQRSAREALSHISKIVSVLSLHTGADRLVLRKRI